MLFSKNISCLFSICLIAATVFAQDKPVQLFGEGSGNHVKLLWVPKSWPKGTTGFDIMRRTVDNNERGNWVLVNATPIVPELSRSKELTNVESDPTALARLQRKLENYLSTNKVRETSRQDYLQKLSSDPNAVKALYLPIALDFDFALLNGFALVDRKAPTGGNYEYGLFLVQGNQRQPQPTAVFAWKYGDKTEPKLSLNLKVLPTGTASTLEIRWDFSYRDYLAQAVNGFNIYRQSSGKAPQKLNDAPLWVTSEGTVAQLSFFDKNAEGNVVYTYAVAPNSMFGTEGSRQEVIFDPSKQPGKVVPPVLKAIEEPAGKLGIQFEWEFSKASQQFIKGFVLQRRENVEAAYKDVSPQLPPTGTSATDLPPANGKYYLYRLRVVDDFGLNLFSNELLIFYDPRLPPPSPTGLTGTFEKSGNQQFIHLAWDKKSPSDTLTKGYYLYSSFPPNKQLMLEGNIPAIEGNDYRYEIFSPVSTEYHFAITAVSNRKAESAMSNEISVITPSQQLPKPNIWPFTVNGNRITLEWTYEGPPDLAGFRIFQDDQLVAGEKALGASALRWTSPPLAANTTYKFELQAVSTTNVVSKKSIARTITTAAQ